MIGEIFFEFNLPILYPRDCAFRCPRNINAGFTPFPAFVADEGLNEPIV